MMLENFVWEVEILKSLSFRRGQNNDDGKEEACRLSDDLAERVSRSCFVMESYTTVIMIIASLYDSMIHSGPRQYEYDRKMYNAMELYKVMILELSFVKIVPNTAFVASWYHPMMGYNAGYYSYYWSEAYAADLFHEFLKGR
eukprot:CAMPEP_0172478994 /NCGR_PEP_ID=MMETSP1066-20121228/3250_1 /TAXON_ID=671091 /ORGANISM="Coscinodiscus wailesii, Strain CCMP2513" /LENGTH=141 /DNA_ID=CAMNT_0013239017 /DNA_START=280 /DNA_END=705 /DNA_ORIENTATION=+